MIREQSFEIWVPPEISRLRLVRRFVWHDDDCPDDETGRRDHPLDVATPASDLFDVIFKCPKHYDNLEPDAVIEPTDWPRVPLCSTEERTGVHSGKQMTINSQETVFERVGSCQQSVLADATESIRGSSVKDLGPGCARMNECIPFEGHTDVRSSKRRMFTNISQLLVDVAVSDEPVRKLFIVARKPWTTPVKELLD